MKAQLIGKSEDTEIRGYVETILYLTLPDGKPNDTRVNELIAIALRHPRLQPLNPRLLLGIVRHSLIVLEWEMLDERLYALAPLLPTHQMRYTAVDIAVSVAVSMGEMNLNVRRRLEELQLIMGLSDEEIDEILGKYS